ncbi:hypothetical protein T492DRAFT_916278 [Pavlovales sp. CCMP2436]|nr:hypothetical protein T492DRAFT_916278 [Pavlovales sp. CCMP2436]
MARRLGALLLLCATHAHASGDRLLSAGPLSARQLRAYERDGVILVRGLLSPDEVRAAVAAAEEIQRCSTTQSLHVSPALRHVALHSRAPAIVAQLMTHAQLPGKGTPPIAGAPAALPPGEQEAGQEVRVLKDAFLSYEPGKSGCGWHRDDRFFWPCPENEGPGVNVWVALSSYSPRHGGGLAVSRGSFRAPWRDRAINAISSQTCALAELNPRLNRLVDKGRKEWRMEPGDAIVHARHCFHKGVPFTKAGLRSYTKKSSSPLLRYSVRYMPASSSLDKGSFDPAVTKLKLGGKQLRELGWRYPRCWPDVDPAEEAQLELVQRASAKLARAQVTRGS